MIILMAAACVLLAILCFVLSAILVAGFFLPTATALQRGHKHWFAIFLANLFLGWTVVGWVVILAWAGLGPFKCRCKAGKLCS